MLNQAYSQASSSAVTAGSVLIEHLFTCDQYALHYITPLTHSAYYTGVHKQRWCGLHDDAEHT